MRPTGNVPLCTGGRRGSWKKEASIAPCFPACEPPSQVEFHGRHAYRTRERLLVRAADKGLELLMRPKRDHPRVPPGHQEPSRPPVNTLLPTSHPAPKDSIPH